MTARRVLPARPRLTLRHQECRRVLEAAGLFELAGERRDAGVRLRTARDGRARPLDLRNGPGGRRPGGRLGVAIADPVADQELDAVVAQAQRLPAVPQRGQLLVVETEILEHAHGAFGGLRHLAFLAKLGRLLEEERILLLRETRPVMPRLLHLVRDRRVDLLLDGSNLLLLRVPPHVTRPVLAGQAFDVHKRPDVGELARLLLLQGLQQHRQRGLVVALGLFHRLLAGAQTLELLDGFVLTAEKVAFARPLAFHKPLLRFAREAPKQLLVFLRPRPRRLDGGHFGPIVALGLAGDRFRAGVVPRRLAGVRSLRGRRARARLPAVLAVVRFSAPALTRGLLVARIGERMGGGTCRDRPLAARHARHNVALLRRFGGAAVRILVHDVLVRLGRTAARAANPKFARFLGGVRLRTSGSKAALES